MALNQVLARLVDGPTTEALIAEIQSDGRIWCGPTQWDGATAMRISVSSWKTRSADATFAADVILDCAARIHPHSGHRPDDDPVGNWYPADSRLSPPSG